MFPTAARTRLPGIAATNLAWDFVTLCTVCFLASSTVSAQTLEDFRKAAGSRGVECVPFPKLNADANSIAKDVEARKKAATEDHSSASTLTKQKGNLLWEVQKTQEKIKAKEEEIDKFKRDYPGGATGPLEEERDKLKTELTEDQKKVDEKNREILAAAEAWERFWNARGGLRDVFDDVLKELETARSSPGTYLGSSPSDEDIKRLNEYIGAIKNQIQTEGVEHLIQENGAKGTEKELRDLLKKDKF